MRLLFLFILVFPLVACGNIDDLLDALAGHKYEVVVLAKEPVVLDNSALTMHPTSPMKVVGETSSVCLVLADKVEPNAEDTKLFETIMSGATVKISAKLVSGDTLTFSEPMKAWRRKGRILNSNELSGCAAPCCEDRKKLAKGVEIKEVIIVSTKPLKVHGIFWESTNAFDGLGNK